MINSRKYRLKENILDSLNKRFEDVMDQKPEFDPKEIKQIIEGIIKSNVGDGYLMPFNREIIPLGSNKLKTKDLFYNKRYYNEIAFPKAMPEGAQDTITGNAVDDMSQYHGESRYIFAPFHSIDFIYEKALYGRIDTHNRPIYPSQKFLKLLPGTTDIMLLDFVCEALEDMLNKINKLKDMNKLSKKSIYYNFQVKSGWTDNLEDHHKVMKSVFESFVEKYAKNSSDRIKDFNDFRKEFIVFLNAFLPLFPMTRSNLQLRRLTNPRMSGISFEISLKNHDDDKKKYTEYILDEHFLQIQNVANTYGFMVDKHAPWRFVADLESPQMRHRMEEKGFNTLQDMFDNRYYQTHFFEINAIKKYMISFYDSYVDSYPYYTETKKCGDGSKSKLTYRKKARQTDFSDRKLIEFYFFIRAKEANKDWDQEYFNLSVEEAYKVYEHYGLNYCLNHIHDKTCLIVGDGANSGFRTKKEENYRIFSSHQSYSNRRTFTIKL